MSPRIGKPRDATGKPIGPDEIVVAHSSFASGVFPGLIQAGTRLKGSDPRVAQHSAMFVHDGIDAVELAKAIAPDEPDPPPPPTFAKPAKPIPLSKAVVDQAGSRSAANEAQVKARPSGYRPALHETVGKAKVADLVKATWPVGDPTEPASVWPGQHVLRDHPFVAEYPAHFVLADREDTL